MDPENSTTREALVAEIERLQARIGELEESDARLALQEVVLRRALDFSADGILATDEQGRVIECNSTLERITHFPRARMLLRPLWAVLHDLYPDKLRSAAAQREIKEAVHHTLETGSPDRLNRLVGLLPKCRDANDRVLQPVMFGVRTVRGMTIAGIWRDVTAQTEGEEAQVEHADISTRERLEVRLSRYAQGLEALHQTSLEVNSQHDTTAVLQAIVQRAAELADVETSLLFLTTAEGQALEYALGYRFGGEEPRGLVLRLGEGLSGQAAKHCGPLVIEDYKNWDGRLTEFAEKNYGRVLAVPIKAGDMVLGVLNVLDTERTGPFSAEDIHLVCLFADQAAVALQNARLYEAIQNELAERTRTEQALRESEASYRQIIETAQEGIWILNARDRTALVNQSLAEMFGYTGREMIGKSIYDYQFPEDHIDTQIRLAQRRQGISGQTDMRFRHKDGGEVWVHISANPIFDADGCYLGALGMFTDVTERRRVEQDHEALIAELQKALAEVKRLGGLLPICASCKKIRTDEGYWEQVEVYIAERSEAQFSHGYCPDCARKLFPEYYVDERPKRVNPGGTESEPSASDD